MDNTITNQLMKFKVAELKQELIRLGIQPRGNYFCLKMVKQQNKISVLLI